MLGEIRLEVYPSVNFYFLFHHFFPFFFFFLLVCVLWCFGWEMVPLLNQACLRGAVLLSANLEAAAAAAPPQLLLQPQLDGIRDGVGGALSRAERRECAFMLPVKKSGQRYSPYVTP